MTKLTAIPRTSQNEVISTPPSYFEENGYKNPMAPSNTLRIRSSTAFDWLATKPRLQQAFNVVMTMSRTMRSQRWFDFFPAEDKLRVASTSDTVLVDIGGGVGHDLIAFKQQCPSLPGKLILQEIPVVIDSIKDLPARIDATKHDFFVP